MEKRLLLAFVLSAVIFAVWTVLFPPPEPPEPAPAAAQEEGETTAAGGVGDVAGGGGLADVEAEAGIDDPGEGAPVGERIEGAVEERVRLVNEVLAVELSSRGAAVTELVLAGYQADGGGPLDLVQGVDHPLRTLPLQLVWGGGIDERMYAVDAVERGYRFRWSDGTGSAVEKTITLAEGSSYQLAVEVRLSGGAREALLSVGTGMRDTTEAERANRFASWGDVAVGLGDDVERLKREKVKESETFRGPGITFAGFADTYFLNLWRPRGGLALVRVEPLEVQETNEDGEEQTLRVLTVSVGAGQAEFGGELFAAPKEYSLLKRVGGGVEAVLHFGFIHPISLFFLKALQWIHSWAHNYGLAIILLTLGIRIVLFPLMHTSTVSMRKMQKVQPKAKAIQEKYRKNKSDPQVRAKMNQEMMQLYKEEGVNPMGGCLPILVQLPILWSLYTLFAYAIELRHAPFMLWIEDLSAKDPLYITPVLMTATMWLQQRMAPQAGDPQQQRIMRMMPLIFGIMFLGFPSGLVLYWLSNNVITILQQEVTFRLMGERRGFGRSRGGRKGRGR